MEVGAQFSNTHLKTLSVETDTHGSLLVPLINEKLPNDLKLLIARQFDSDVWSLSKMLEYLKKEIEAKERATLTCASYSQIRDQTYEGKYSLLTLKEPNFVALQTDSTAVNVNSCKNKAVLLQTVKLVSIRPTLYEKILSCLI